MLRHNNRLWISAAALAVLLIAWAMGDKNFPLARLIRTALHGLF
jgi:hypothetical protein